MNPVGNADLDGTFRCLFDPALAVLDSELSTISALGREERLVLSSAAAQGLTDAVRPKVSRLLLLELNAARAAGQLRAADSRARWNEFVRGAAEPGYWQALAAHYPTLLGRIGAVVDGRVQAVLELGRRYAADRSSIGQLTGVRAAELTAARFGEGDSHRGGRTVAKLQLGSATVMYKPRSLTADWQLARLLDVVLPQGADSRIRVPRVLTRPDYGWAEFVTHRYCDSDAELRHFYTGLGHWLAMSRLLGATDLHAQNLIACGPVPVVIDCETLFVSHPTAPPSGNGEAADLAAALLSGTVLRSGLLPGRGTRLGWRGMDSSAIGGWRGEQPDGQVLRIIDEGTDLARIGSVPAHPMQATNLPSPEPQLHRFWPDVVAGFDELVERLIALDAHNSLEGLLAAFTGVELRSVPRATEVYTELGQMLWHPISLHDEPAAVARASTLLLRQGQAVAGAPTDLTVIAAEVADLLVGDVPYFSTRPGTGTLSGPGGISIGTHPEPVADRLRRWRVDDLALERSVIRSTLVSGYLNEGWLREGRPLPVRRHGPRGQLERRRRRLAAHLTGQLLDAAIIGDDRTATWIAPTLSGAGWSVQPLGPDGYSGLAGIAVLLGGYLHEVETGRADPIEGVAEALHQVLNSMRLGELTRSSLQEQDLSVRPEPPGLHVGLGSQIGCWLELRRLGMVGEEGLCRAVALGAQLPAAVEASPEVDLLLGASGAAIASLQLAEVSGERRWLDQAKAFGTRIAEAAVFERSGIARWPSPLTGAGIGGFSHGATGIGWALARLGATTGSRQLVDIADAAFAFEETLYDQQQACWVDLRFDDAPAATAWCHGAAGIGLASADLVRLGDAGAERHRDVVRRAAAACWRRGGNGNHSLCHGDAGRWDLLSEAAALGLNPVDLDLDQVTEQLIASIEQHGVVTGIGDDACTPGMLPGLGGVTYQLLRMHPDSDLPSVLVPRLAQPTTAQPV